GRSALLLHARVQRIEPACEGGGHGRAAGAEAGDGGVPGSDPVALRVVSDGYEFSAAGAAVAGSGGDCAGGGAGAGGTSAVVLHGGTSSGGDDGGGVGEIAHRPGVVGEGNIGPDGAVIGPFPAI